jgi:hypothetical protein
MRRVVLMSGLPGSGKSRYVAERFGAPRFFPNNVRGCAPVSVEVLSVDAWFVGADGVYRFDPARLGEAHNACICSFAIWAVRPIEGGYFANTVVVDNTATTVAELAPYVAIARAFEIPCELITLDCSPEEAIARNTHGVPAGTIHAMHAALRARVLPPYWSFAKEAIIATNAV